MILFEKSGQPSFVISQEWVTAADSEHPAPSEDELGEYLLERGFEPVPNSYFGWLRREDGVLIVDAKPDNFVKTVEGVAPIDLQMARMPLEDLPAATPAESESLIIRP
jgi:hypothetical protein